MTHSLPASVVKALAERYGYADLGPSSQQVLAEVFGPELAQRVMEDVLETLPLALQETAGALIEKGDGEGLFALLEANVSDFAERLRNAMPA